MYKFVSFKATKNYTFPSFIHKTYKKQGENCTKCGVENISATVLTISFVQSFILYIRCKWGAF